MQFYYMKNSGFEKLGKRKNYYNGVDGILMERKKKKKKKKKSLLC